MSLRDIIPLFKPRSEEEMQALEESSSRYATKFFAEASKVKALERLRNAVSEIEEHRRTLSIIRRVPKVQRTRIVGESFLPKRTIIIARVQFDQVTEGEKRDLVSSTLACLNQHSDAMCCDEDILGVYITLTDLLFHDAIHTVDVEEALGDCGCSGYVVKWQGINVALYPPSNDPPKVKEALAAWSLLTIMIGKNTSGQAVHLNSYIDKRKSELKKMLVVKMDGEMTRNNVCIRFGQALDRSEPMRHYFAKILMKLSQAKYDESTMKAVDHAKIMLAGSFLTTLVAVHQELLQENIVGAISAIEPDEMEKVLAYLTKAVELTTPHPWYYVRLLVPKYNLAPLSPSKYPILANVALRIAARSRPTLRNIPKPAITPWQSAQVAKILAVIDKTREYTHGMRAGAHGAIMRGTSATMDILTALV